MVNITRGKRAVLSFQKSIYLSEKHLSGFFWQRTSSNERKARDKLEGNKLLFNSGGLLYLLVIRLREKNSSYFNLYHTGHNQTREANGLRRVWQPKSSSNSPCVPLIMDVLLLHQKLSSVCEFTPSRTFFQCQ